MEENLIVFIPRSSKILQGDKLSLLALPCSTTESKLKNKCRNMRCIAPNDGVCVLNGVEPSIYSPTRTVHGDLNLVGGETVLCMPPCNCLKKVGPSYRHRGCARTTGGPPWPPPSRGRFVSRPWSFPWLRMDPVLCFGGLFHLYLICAFSEYAFLKCAFSCLLRLSTCHTWNWYLQQNLWKG